MDFKKLDGNKVRCRISEAEIEDMGYSLSEIMQNGQKTKEFMDHVFAMAEEHCDVDFTMAVRTVQAELRPDHTLILTFSQYSAEEMFKSEDFLHSLMAAIEKEKGGKGSLAVDEDCDHGTDPSDKKREEKADEGDKLPNQLPQIIVLLVFDNMEQVIRFAKQMRSSLMPENALYKYKKRYYLRVDLSGFTDQQVQKLSMITDEYVEEMLAGSARSAFIEEHGEILIKEKAIESLKLL